MPSRRLRGEGRRLCGWGGSKTAKENGIQYLEKFVRISTLQFFKRLQSAIGSIPFSLFAIFGFT
jgi:hypothetical protein